MLKVMVYTQTRRLRPQIPNSLLWLSGAIVIVTLSSIAWFSASWEKMPSAVSINNANPTLNPIDMDAYYEQIGSMSEGTTVSVKSWNVLGVAANQSTAEAKIYPLISNATQSNLTALVARMEGAKIEAGSVQNETDSVSARLTVGQASAQIHMEKSSGRYDIQVDEGGIPIPQTTANNLVNIQNYVQKLMGGDTTIEVTASYMRRDTPDIMYYEAHRSWSAVGMPIVNAQELFAQTNHSLLSDVSFIPTVRQVSELVDDENIIKTSDERSGKVRSDRVNTITVGVREGKITSIVSRMRQFGTGRPGVESILNMEEALTRLTREGFEYIYIDTQKAEHLDPEKIYPNERVVMNTARVREGRLMYLEEVEVAQKSLASYYVFIGTGTLENGQVVDFLAAVPAVRNINSRALQKPKITVMSRKIRQIIEHGAVAAHAQD